MTREANSLCQKIEAAKAGDPAAFADLVDAFTSRLLLFLRHIGGSLVRGDADEDDLLQETLCLVHRNLAKYEHRSSDGFYRWVVAIARNVVSNRAGYLDAKGRRMVHPIESALPSSQVGPASPATSPSGHAVRREEVERLRNALASLPRDQREVVEWKVLEGMSFAEVAARSNVAKTTAFERLHAGMVELERQLGLPLSSAEP